MVIRGGAEREVCGRVLIIGSEALGIPRVFGVWSRWEKSVSDA